MGLPCSLEVSGADTQHYFCPDPLLVQSSSPTLPAVVSGSPLQPLLDVKFIPGGSEWNFFANSAVKETISKKQRLKPKQGRFQLNRILSILFGFYF